MLRSPVLALTAGILTGCTSHSSQRSYDRVRSAIEQRGSMPVSWHRAGDDPVAAAVDQILAARLSADQAVLIALLRNRSIQESFENLAIAQSDLVEAGLLGNPVFSGEVRLESGGSDTFLELSVAQEFLDVLYIPLRKKMAVEAQHAAELKVTLDVLRLAGEVRRQYYRYQAAEKLVHLRRTIMETAQAAYEFAQRLQQAGNITDLELVETQVAYEDARLDASTSELIADQARERLNGLMGLWGDDTAWTVEDGPSEAKPMEIPLAEFVQQAIASSLDLELGRSALAQAATRTGAARTVTLLNGASLGIAAEREPGEDEDPEGGRDGERRRSNDDDDQWSVGPSLSLPIPLFNRGRAARDRAEAEFRKRSERYAALAVQIRAEARAAHRAAAVLCTQARHQREVVAPLHRQILESTQRQYNAMQVGTFQLLQAKRQELEAEVRLVNTLRNCWIAHTDTAQILGGVRVPLDDFAVDDADDSSTFAVNLSSGD